jgi:CBS domain-containing protein
VARRGYHLSREYAIDPLEILFVREVMHANVVALPADMPLAELADSLHDGRASRRHKLYPVVNAERHLMGVVSSHQLHKLLQAPDGRRLADVVNYAPEVAYADEPLRVTVYRMAETGFTLFPVVENHGSRKLAGLVSLEDLLKARVQTLDAERLRERVLPLRLKFPIRRRRQDAA